MIEHVYKSNKGRYCFTAKIAGVVFEITTVYPSAIYFCKDYLSDEKPMTSINITNEEIEQEIEKGNSFYYTCTEYDNQTVKLRTSKKEINKNRIENVVLYRKIIETALPFGVFFLHGAVIAVNDAAYIFSAPSGTGKTTHIQKWIKRVENSYIVNGDKPLIRVTKSSVIACGNPWCGNENYGTNTMVPVNSIILMERSDDNRIEEITFMEAYYLLLNQVYIPSNKSQAEMELRLISGLNGRVRFFKFYFNNFKEDCFEIAYNALIGLKHG